MKRKTVVGMRFRTEKELKDFMELPDKEYRAMQLRNLLDSTMKSVNRKSRMAGYGDIMRKVK